MSQPISPPTNPIPGAIYTEDSTGIAWVWTGVGWIEAGGSDGYNAQVRTGMAITPGFYTALSSTTAGGSGGQNLSQIATQYGPVAPTNPAFGQTWVDTTDPGRPVTYVWTDPGSWTKTSDGVTNMYVQNTTPTDQDVGDQWFNTAANDLRVWDGTQWRQIIGGGGGGIATSFQTYGVAPAVLTEGSVYYNSTEDKAYISNGSAWVELDQAPDIDTNSITAIAAPTTRANGDALEASDLWVDTGSNAINYYDGSQWIRISSATVGDTHSFWQATAPTLRPDNTVLEQGDIWVDSNSVVAHVWTGSLWSPLLSDEDNNTNSIVSAAPPIQRNTPTDTALQAGDLWVNTGDLSINYFTGLTWIPLTAQTSATGDKHSFSGPANPTITTRPDGNPLLTGDQWINTSTNVLYYWSGSAWIGVTGSADTDTHSFTGTGNPQGSFIARPDLSALQDGDMYVDDATNTIYYYDLSAGLWKSTGSASNDTHSFTGTGAPTLTTRPDTTSLQDGDMYVDDTTNTPYYYDLSATTWKPFASGSDTHSFTGTGAPALSLRPDATPLLTGDQYIDDTTDQLYYWTAGPNVWTAVSAGNDTHSFTGTGAPALALRPDGTALQDGDIYVDDSTNGSYYYDLSAITWKPISATVPNATSTIPGIIKGNTTYTENTFLGARLNDITNTLAGFRYNTFLGTSIAEGDAFQTTAANLNTVVGAYSAYSLRNAESCIIIGAFAGEGIDDDYNVTVVGALAGTSSGVDSTDSTFVGYKSFVNGSANSVGVGSFAGGRSSGSSNIYIGFQAGDRVTSNNTAIIGGYGFVPETIPDGTFILARPSINPNTLLRINENNALGIPTTNGSTTVNYGAAGEVLTSQGTTAPPIWAAAGGGTDTHSFTGTGAPALALRPDATPLLSGDQYIDDTTDQLYYWTAGPNVWTAVAGGGGTDTHSFTGTGAPALSLRPDATPLLTGDQYIDDTTDQLYYWTAGPNVWTAVAGVAASSATPTTEGIVFARTVNDTNYNTAFGYGAGLNLPASAIETVYVGSNAGTNASGGENVMIGSHAGESAAGSYCTFIGSYAGAFGTHTSATNYNTSVGAYTMSNALTSGDSNTVLGAFAAVNISTGSNNTLIGPEAGKLLTTGSGNTVLGSWHASGEAAVNNNIILSVSNSVSNGLVNFNGISFRINENNAYGIPTTNDPTTSTVSYGAAGETLQSQGNANPPQWVAGASGTFTTTDGKTVTVTNGLITLIV